MNDKLRLLIVEDDEADAELASEALVSAGFDVELTRVDTADGLVRALDEREFDAVLSDYAMPGFDGLRAFAIFLERRLDIPFIFVSGALGEERAVEAMRAGAHDYLLKGHLGRLAVAMRRELRASRNRRQKTTAEESARRHQRRLALAVEASGVGIFESMIPADEDTFVAERCAALLGVRQLDLPAPEDLANWVLARIHPDDSKVFTEAATRFLSGAIPTLEMEVRVRHERGHYLDLDVRVKAVSRDPHGRVEHLVGVVLDLTERKGLEMHARQSQKMEAIGRLAGGVAHDFNNLLTAIFSFGSFVLDGLGQDDPVRADMEEVMKASRRAAGLTNQLLAFSRLKKTRPRVVSMREVVVNVERMLSRLLGEDIDFRVEHDGRDPRIKIDPAELEQVLVNLTVNARDAMPRGGRLTVRTERVVVDQPLSSAGTPRVAVGDYGRLVVNDTGMGMDESVIARAFDPFFTTKEPGRGTGLGLATCYGIVYQAGGFITVASEPGLGATFSVYLPIDASGEVTAEAPEERAVHAGTERVLVVEDDAQVRALAVRALERRGYTVLSAPCGDDALALCAADPSPIALLLTDVVMPGMSGRELADRLVALRPDIRILYMSGYAPSAVMDRGELAADATMIQKPFTPDTLAREVRAALDAPRTPAADP